MKKPKFNGAEIEPTGNNRRKLPHTSAVASQHGASGASRSRPSTNGTATGGVMRPTAASPGGGSTPVTPRKISTSQEQQKLKIANQVSASTLLTPAPSSSHLIKLLISLVLLAHFHTDFSSRLVIMWCLCVPLFSHFRLLRSAFPFMFSLLLKAALIIIILIKENFPARRRLQIESLFSMLTGEVVYAKRTTMQQFMVETTIKKFRYLKANHEMYTLVVTHIFLILKKCVCLGNNLLNGAKFKALKLSIK